MRIEANGNERPYSEREIKSTHRTLIRQCAHGDRCSPCEIWWKPSWLIDLNVSCVRRSATNPFFTHSYILRFHFSTFSCQLVFFFENSRQPLSYVDVKHKMRLFPMLCQCCGLAKNARELYGAFFFVFSLSLSLSLGDGLKFTAWGPGHSIRNRR